MLITAADLAPHGRRRAGCLEWTGHRNGKGYGQITVEGRTYMVHRVAWSLANDQEIPPGIQIRHRCDNPPCFDDAHLLPGTNLDNVHDRVARGRSARGERHSSNRLTELQVRAVRRRLSGGISTSDIAVEFEVSDGCIQAIRAGRTWAWLV